MKKRGFPQTRDEIDKFVRIHGLRPIGMFSYKNRDVFIAETDLEMDRPIEYPWGYYETAWFASSIKNPESFGLGRWIEFESMHDKEQNWTQETKRKARMQTAINDAIKFIDNSG